ncbi:hypothetical protein TNCV_964811 [Trichonephila clavipes]|nr:hypothetical protein TNCV_964811 [Trichonephila clavipes]
MYISVVREGRTAREGQQVADLQVVFLGQRCSPINGEQRLTGYLLIRIAQLTVVTNKNATFINGTFLMPPLLAFTALDPFSVGGSQCSSSQAEHLKSPFFEVDALTVWLGLKSYMNLV